MMSRYCRRDPFYETALIYNRGVKKGQTDVWGMTTEPGETAKKTVYGAAVQEISVTCKQNDSILDLMQNIFTWYQEHPQWNFGGIDMIRREGDHYQITLYAGGILDRESKIFHIENGKWKENGGLRVCRIRGSGKSSLGLPGI